MINNSDPEHRSEEITTKDLEYGNKNDVSIFHSAIVDTIYKNTMAQEEVLTKQIQNQIQQMSDLY